MAGSCVISSPHFCSNFAKDDLSAAVSACFTWRSWLAVLTTDDFREDFSSTSLENAWGAQEKCKRGEIFIYTLKWRQAMFSQHQMPQQTDFIKMAKLRKPKVNMFWQIKHFFLSTLIYSAECHLLLPQILGISWSPLQTEVQGATTVLRPLASSHLPVKPSWCFAFPLCTVPSVWPHTGAEAPG